MARASEGPAPASGHVTIHADGRDVRVSAGVTIAAALLDLGFTDFRRSVRGGPRGPVCGMGTCFECRVTVDGVPHRRACLVVVADGMRILTGSSDMSRVAAAPAAVSATAVGPSDERA
jgi:sarcosine oxidase subunit alpha